MTVDVIVGLLFGVMLFFGWRTGAVTQVLRIAAAVLALFGAVFVSGPVGDVVWGVDTETSAWQDVLAIFLAGVLIYIAVAVTGWVVVKLMRATSEKLSKVDRAGGAAIGGIKALLMVYFIVAVVVLLEVPLAKADPSNALHLRGGYATGFVEEHNVLAPWSLPDLDRLHMALKVRYFAEEFGREHVLREHGQASDFLRRTAVDDLADDKALMQAVLDDQYAHTITDPRVRAVLDDDEFVEGLAAVNWQTLLSDVKSPVHAHAARRELSER